MKRDLFVSFEGIEGCGKTTQIQLLSRHLDDCGIPHILTREPGGTAVGEGIRRILLNSESIHLTAASELLLFYASRSQNIEEKIRPARAAAQMVLCDRYYHASMAYQGYGRGIPLEFIDKLTDLVCSKFRPDLTILLDIDPEAGLRRARARNNATAVNEGRFEAEDLDFYRKVRLGYMELAARDTARIRVIEANRSIEEVHRRILQTIEQA